MEAIVGPHTLSYKVIGHGSPTVVIEPGFGDDSSGWQPMALRLADLTTVLLYDRAAYGTSARAQDSRSGADVARDLAGLLDWYVLFVILLNLKRNIAGVIDQLP